MNTNHESRDATSGVRSRLLSVSLSGLITMSALLAACSSTGPQHTLLSASGQRTFSTPLQALDALLAAARSGDRAALSAIFGDDKLELLSTGDPVSDALTRQEFCEAADECMTLVAVDEGVVGVMLGDAAWPSPIPLVRQGGRWYFDTAAGIDEILSRRIGHNELAAIDLCRSYLDAQYIYRARDWNDDGVREFAQVIVSTPGQFDGLYWPADMTGDMPLCPLDGLVTENEAYIEGREQRGRQASPWFGYIVKTLTAQGKDAPGGVSHYIDDGHMTEGFALVAWPERYRDTGVMTFLVSHHGTIYEKDLGPGTAKLAAAMQVFDPGDGWSPVQ